MCCFNVYSNLFFLVHWFLSFLPKIFKLLEGSSTSTTSTSSTSTSSTTTVPFRCRTLVEDNVEVEMQRWNGWNLRGVFFCCTKPFKNTLVVVGYIRSGYKWLQQVLDKIMINPSTAMGAYYHWQNPCDFMVEHSAESDRFHPAGTFLRFHQYSSQTYLKKSVDHFSLGNKSVLGKTMIIVGLHRNFVESGRD